jgi:hypothetical protein
MRTGRLIVGVISYLAIGSFVLAQTAASVIRGTIQDATGAVLPDVHVTLRDETRNQSWTQTTNEDFFGTWALPFGITPSKWNIPASKKS